MNRWFLILALCAGLGVIMFHAFSQAQAQAGQQSRPNADPYANNAAPAR